MDKIENVQKGLKGSSRKTRADKHRSAVSWLVQLFYECEQDSSDWRAFFRG